MKKKKTFNPPTSMSPGDGPNADQDVPPCMAWAEVVARRQKPKVEIPTEFLNRNPEYKKL